MKPSKKDAKPISTKKITVLIRENGAPNITLEQFTEILKSINEICSSINRINGAPDSEIIIGALDSGSEKSIDIIGVGQTISALSNLLLEFWDRIRFAKADGLKRKISTMGEGVTIITQLHAAQEKGAISAEEAEKLRRSLLRNVELLFLSGVHTKEMEELVPIYPAQVEVQRKKLITYYAKQKEAPEIPAIEPPADDDEEPAEKD